MSQPGREILVFPDRASLMDAAAERIVAAAGQAIARRGRFLWVLSGGSTPAALYARIATARFAGRIDWGRVHLFWGDERCVPADDPASNHRMVRETLLDAVAPPPEHVHRMRGEAEPEEEAARYEGLLRGFAEPGGAPPRFDLVLLGMGADGHTASLFPGSAAAAERRRWVVAVQAGSGPRRLTLTPVVLEAAAEILFLVAGSDKATRLAEVLGDGDGALPAQRIRPTDGALRWLVDAEAASGLPDQAAPDSQRTTFEA